MIATIISSDVDLDLVLQRADRRYAQRHGWDPADNSYLAELAQAVQAQLVDQPTVPDQRRGEDALRKAEMAGHLAERIETLERDAAQLADQLQQARDEQTQEQQRAAELGEQHAGVLAENVKLLDRLDVSRDERERLVAELDELRGEVARLRKKTTRTPRPRPVPHRHFYPWLGEAGAYGPCECSKPYPRIVDEGEPVEPDVEPLDALFARIRAEIGEGGDQS